jgi:hypothetical protein
MRLLAEIAYIFKDAKANDMVESTPMIPSGQAAIRLAVMLSLTIVEKNTVWIIVILSQKS